MNQRYKNAANWDMIAAAAEIVDIPLIGVLHAHVKCLALLSSPLLF